MSGNITTHYQVIASLGVITHYVTVAINLVGLINIAIKRLVGSFMFGSVPLLSPNITDIWILPLYSPHAIEIGDCSSSPWVGMPRLFCGIKIRLT